MVEPPAPMSSPDESKQIAKEAFTLSASNYLCRVIYLVRGLGVAALLQPELYGIWSVLKNLQDSTAFGNLGASWALLREVSVNKAAGDTARIERLQGTSLNLAILVTTVICLLILPATFTDLLPDIGDEMRISLVVMVLASITYYIPRQLQAQTEFYFQAQYLLVYAALNAVLSMTAVYFWGLHEMLWGLVIAHILAIIYVMRAGHLKLTLTFDPALARALVSAGMPVMIGAALFFFLRAADQFLIYSMIGSVAAGYYALSNFVAMTVTQIPVALAATLFPRMMERQNAGASRQEIEHLFIEPLKVLSLGVPILLGAAYFGMEPMLAIVLPDYLPALPVVRIALIGIFFQSVWSLSHSLLLSFDKQRQQMWIALALLLANIAAVALTIRAGGSVEMVTWVASGVSILSAFVILFYIFHLLDRALSKNLATCLHLFWPMVYAGVAAVFIDQQITAGESLLGLILSACLELVLFLLASVPLALLIWKKAQALR